ncbi:MAG TPA: glutaredoxin family protein [Vicinamibacteria bacterium]|nr:glutaredoxin family protein [Vicinamibacteria bacterium]
MGKPECHLCDDMREVVERTLRGSALRLVEVDVRDHPDLEKRYVFEIPVLLLGEREIARHRVTEAELRRRLGSLLRS